jgi:Holliday junction resolvasome RuvABC DNA-binding subunit
MKSIIAAYTPITDEEYRTTVNIIFDKLFDENEDIYAALKDKLANVVSEKVPSKKQREKGSPLCFTEEDLDALHNLAFKWKMSHEQVIERLINEHYVKECKDASGEPLY